MTNYITSGCIIRNNTVVKNGETIFQQDAALPEFLRALYDRYSGQYPKFHKMDLLSKLGWVATEILLQDIPMNIYQPENIAIVLANKSSSLDTDERYFETIKDIASPALFVYTLPNIVIGEISIRHGFKGENAFFVADHFDVDFMAGYAQQLLETNAAEACIMGWTEQYHDHYEAALFLVENEQRGMALPFTVEEIKKLYL